MRLQKTCFLKVGWRKTSIFNDATPATHTQTAYTPAENQTSFPGDFKLMPPQLGSVVVFLFSAGAKSRKALPSPAILDLECSCDSHFQTGPTSNFKCLFYVAISVVLVKCNFVILFLPSFNGAVSFTQWEGWATYYLDQDPVYGLLQP